MNAENKEFVAFLRLLLSRVRDPLLRANIKDIIMTLDDETYTNNERQLDCRIDYLTVPLAAA
jgi:hypothetical protein